MPEGLWLFSFTYLELMLCQGAIDVSFLFVSSEAPGLWHNKEGQEFVNKTKEVQGFVSTIKEGKCLLTQRRGTKVCSTIREVRGFVAQLKRRRVCEHS